jgi:DNA-binding GntR family transcriptional regulator
MTSLTTMPGRGKRERPSVHEGVLPVAERVYRRLRDAIATGELPPRGRLSERDLSATLGVSTSPVKAALARLEAEGMVVTQPRRGTWVAFDPAKLAEMGLIRAALEGVAARLAAGRITEAQLGQLRAILAELGAATEALDTARLIEANERLHATVLAAADNAFLANAVKALRGYYLMTQRRMRTAQLEPHKAQAEHEAIVAALAARDGAAAEAAMRAHIARTVETLWAEHLARNRA